MLFEECRTTDNYVGKTETIPACSNGTKTGTTSNIRESKSCPLSLFMNFLTDEIVETFCRETNCYAAHK